MVAAKTLTRKEKASLHMALLLANLPAAPTAIGQILSTFVSCPCCSAPAQAPSRMEPNLPLLKQLNALRAPCLGTLESVPKALLSSLVGWLHCSFRSQVEPNIQPLLKDTLSTSSESLLCKGQSALFQDRVLYTRAQCSIPGQRALFRSTLAGGIWTDS